MDSDERLSFNPHEPFDLQIEPMMILLGNLFDEWQLI
jgi:hypothetical protein